MNGNIATLKRVRGWHSKLLVLNAGQEIGALPPESPSDDEDLVREKDRRWTGLLRADKEESRACLDWMTEKVMEHNGFQGAF